MSEKIKSRGVGKSRYAEIGVIVLFVLGVAVWLWQWDALTYELLEDWDVHRGCGLIGVGMIGPVVAAVSIFLLLASISLVVVAWRLPIWFRLVSLVPWLMASAVGVAMCYRVHIGTQ